MNPTTYFRLYWRKSESCNWSGGYYIDTLIQALDEYKRVHNAWAKDDHHEFKIVEHFIEFEGRTKITKETEYNPEELLQCIT